MQINRVLEWGGGLGSGIWAALSAFTRTGVPYLDSKDYLVSSSSVKEYRVFDKNQGLTNMGQRLLANIELETKISYNKSCHPNFSIPDSERPGTISLIAFTLSTLHDPIKRKEQLKEIWNTNTEFIVLVEDGHYEGFSIIAEAREYLLHLGSKEVASGGTSDASDNTKGCHVVAPCPHDKACPVHHYIQSEFIPTRIENPTKKEKYKRRSPKIVCTFSQRMQRPDFVRKIKRSTKGQEDITYSYVVLRRGPRPVKPTEELGREKIPVSTVGAEEQVSRQVWVDADESGNEMVLEAPEIEEPSSPSSHQLSKDDLLSHLRNESYHWPKIILRPLKGSGHVTMDSCTPEGSISRIVIPRSQGKQPFYDARKAEWSDLFPHHPKNPATIRFPAVTLTSEAEDKLKWHKTRPPKQKFKPPKPSVERDREPRRRRYEDEDEWEERSR